MISKHGFIILSYSEYYCHVRTAVHRTTLK